MASQPFDLVAGVMTSQLKGHKFSFYCLAWLGFVSLSRWTSARDSFSRQQSKKFGPKGKGCTRPGPSQGLPLLLLLRQAARPRQEINCFGRKLELVVLVRSGAAAGVLLVLARHFYLFIYCAISLKVARRRCLLAQRENETKTRGEMTSRIKCLMSGRVMTSRSRPHTLSASSLPSVIYSRVGASSLALRTRAR